MELLYEMWLHDLCGFNPQKVAKLLYYFKNAKNAYDSGSLGARLFSAIGFSALSSEIRDLSTAERIIFDCEENNIRLIMLDDEDYPTLLKQTFLPPRILFVYGSLTDFNSYFPFSVVGTRKATPQGILFTKQLMRELTENNRLLIVSGMAEGIDAYAHTAALESGTPTVAVLAGGTDVIYPSSNRSLYHKIIKNGAIISEKPPGTVGRSYSYDMRNRIIAGMSHGTLVVEAGLRSGCRFTVKHALDADRDVFTVPSSPLSRQSKLPNHLIKNGAIVVEDKDDIINEYITVYPTYFNTEAPKKAGGKEASSALATLSEVEKKIVAYISSNGGTANAELMAAELGIPSGRLSSSLTILCIKDMLHQETQNTYLLKIEL